MFKFILFLLLTLACILAYVWFSACALPSWYDKQAQTNSAKSIQTLSKSIENQGFENFLGTKLSGLLSGKLSLNEEEFNALLYVSLMADQDTRKLISASKDLRAQFHQNQLEIGTIINTQSIVKLRPQLRNKISQLTSKFDFLKDKDFYISIIGQPIADNGALALGKNLYIKIGHLKLPSSLLSILGIDINKAQTKTIKLKHLKIKDITIQDERIDMTARPSF